MLLLHALGPLAKVCLSFIVEDDSLREALKAIAEELGAEVSDHFLLACWFLNAVVQVLDKATTNVVTHVVFEQDGSNKMYKPFESAMNSNKLVVAPEWLIR
jgi:hypothetical protein